MFLKGKIKTQTLGSKSDFYIPPIMNIVSELQYVKHGIKSSGSNVLVKIFSRPGHETQQLIFLNRQNIDLITNFGNTNKNTFSSINPISPGLLQSEHQCDTFNNGTKMAAR